MSYYNRGYSGGYGRSYGGGYNRGYNNGGGYNRGYNGGGFNRGGFRSQPKKHSGCKAGMSKGSNPYVRGWKFDRATGMRSFIAGPNKKTKRIKSANGREWENWTLKVQGRNGTTLHNCLYDVHNRKVICDDLSIVMNPSGGAGGYVGPYFRRKN